MAANDRLLGGEPTGESIDFATFWLLFLFLGVIAPPGLPPLI